MLCHPRRRWREPYQVDAPELLAELLCMQPWALCMAFGLANLTLLNDSASESGPQEYAVLRHGQLVDALAVSAATDRQRLACHLRGLTWLVPLRMATSAPPQVGRHHAAGQRLMTERYHASDRWCQLCA